MSVTIPAGETAVRVSYDKATSRPVKRYTMGRTGRDNRLAPRFAAELNIPDSRRRTAGPAGRHQVAATGQNPPAVRGNVEVLDSTVMPLETSHALVRVGVPNDEHSAVICRRQKAAVGRIADADDLIVVT